MTARRSVPAILIALVLALGACGGDDGGDSGSDDGGGDETAAPGSTAEVCEGSTVESAPAYTEGEGVVAIFTDGGDGYELTSYSTDLPEGASALIPEEASVAVCLEVTESEIVDTCEFEDSDTGETFTQLEDRITAAVDRLVARHPGGMVGAVSHGAATRAYVTRLLGIGFEARLRIALLRNTAMGRVVFGSRGPTLAAWNIAPHLEQG